MAAAVALGDPGLGSHLGVSSGISALLYLQVGATLFEGNGLFDTLVRWSQLISLVAQPLTLGGFAVYVVFWLENRRSR
jgi:hypothetical protein